MKTTYMKHVVPALAVVASAMMGSLANAAWNLNLKSACNSDPTTYVVSGCTDSGSGLTSVSGSTTWNSTNNVTFSVATVKEWDGGLGVTSDGNHSIDNNNGTDAILLSFSTAVNITSLTIGWKSGDADFSVLAYTNLDAGVVNGRKLESGPSSLLANGWTLIGNYADAPVSPSSVDVTKSSPTYSSYWLISAYSSYFGTTSSNGGYLGTGTSDYFKLLSVAGNTQPPGNETPEPGSIVLLGAGLFGMMALRRRRSNQSEN